MESNFNAIMNENRWTFLLLCTSLQYYFLLQYYSFRVSIIFSEIFRLSRKIFFPKQVFNSPSFSITVFPFSSRNSLSCLWLAEKKTKMSSEFFFPALTNRWMRFFSFLIVFQMQHCTQTDELLQTERYSLYNSNPTPIRLCHVHFFVRMGRFLMNWNTIDILYLVYSNFVRKKLYLKSVNLYLLRNLDIFSLRYE